jgi:AcrR family transcriptional regulator
VSIRESGSRPEAEPPAGGLRERKKARTRIAIQSHALALFRRQGYEATTVQEIADAAEVSESTFFRYFPTKADVVLSDDFDPVLAAAFRRQPAELTPIGALRAAIADAFAGLSAEELDDQRARSVLALTVPELRAAMLDQLTGAMGLLGELAAERTGRSAGDLDVRTFAGAVIGAVIAASFAFLEDSSIAFAPLLDRTLAHLEGGLRL